MDTVSWLGVTSISLLLVWLLTKFITVRLYCIIMPLGIAGRLQLNVTRVLDGMDVKS